MGLVSELKRRNVFRMAALYVVAAWLVMQVAEVVIGLANLPDWFGQTVLVLLSVGLPIALIFSWFFEVTPEGLSREKDVPDGQSMTHVTGRRMDFVIIAILAAAVLLFAYDKWWPAEAPEQSVAVLPFANVSGLEEENYFADGLSEVILGALAHQPELRVPPRGTIFHAKLKEMDSAEAARALGVQHLLEGSVQRSGDRVRIAVQLTEAKTGYQKWSEVFDRDLIDVFDVQDSIARHVLESLVPILLKSSETKIVGVSTENLDAYDLYLRALEQKYIGTYQSLPQAEGLLKQALALDPDFVEAMVQLAQIYEIEGWTGYIGTEEADNKIGPLVDRALELHPEHTSALILHAARDWERAGNLDEKAAAEQVLRDLAKRFPNESQIYYRLTMVSGSQHKRDEAIRWINRAIELDPFSARYYRTKANIQINDQQFDAAQESISKAIELQPLWSSSYFAAANLARARRHFADSIAYTLKAAEVDPQDHEIPATIAEWLLWLGLENEGQTFLQRALAMAPDAVLPRRVQIHYCLFAQDYECAAELSEEMIRSDRAGREWGNAIRGYLSAMIALEKPDQALVFFEEMWPGVTTDGIPDDQKDGVGMFVLIAMHAAGREDEALRLLDDRVKRLDVTRPDWLERSHSFRGIYFVVRGDFEELVLSELERLTDQGRVFWLRSHAWLEPLLTEPRIAERVAELDAQAAAAHEDVRKVISDSQT